MPLLPTPQGKIPTPGRAQTGVSFEQFMAAISGQESGGNYGAVNRDSGALGKYQIMPANVPAWSQKYLGQSISPQQFLASPALQERLARAVLYDYYNKWGARGAASAWYSGSPNNQNNYKKQGNYPSIGEYVDQVMSKALHISPDQARAEQAGLATTGTNTTTTKYDLANQTPVDKLGPQGKATRPGVSGAEMPGEEAAFAPGAEALMQNAPGVMGQDRQDVFNQEMSQMPDTQSADQNPAPRTQTQQSTFQSARNAHGVQQFLNFAESAMGTPYVWGGAGPGGYDCSGLIYWAAKQAGYSVPRLAAAQMGIGQRVGFDQLQPGDFIGWDNNPNAPGADHIAIYMGNNQILEAPHTGAQVRLRTLGPNDRSSGYAIDTSSLFK